MAFRGPETIQNDEKGRGWPKQPFGRLSKRSAIGKLSSRACRGIWGLSGWRWPEAKSRCLDSARHDRNLGNSESIHVHSWLVLGSRSEKKPKMPPKTAPNERWWLKTTKNGRADARRNPKGRFSMPSAPICVLRVRLRSDCSDYRPTRKREGTEKARFVSLGGFVSLCERVRWVQGLRRRRTRVSRWKVWGKRSKGSTASIRQGACRNNLRSRARVEGLQET